MQRSLLLFALLSTACAHAPVPTPAADLDETRALFEANIRAIQEKDKDAYLACYRQDERLVRVGIDGPKLGFQEFADGTSASGSEDWPSSLIADEVQVHWIEPGVVFGSYKYTVTIAGVTTTGLSERVFLKDKEGAWKIAVSTAFERAPESP